MSEYLSEYAVVGSADGSDSDGNGEQLILQDKSSIFVYPGLLMWLILLVCHGSETLGKPTVETLLLGAVYHQASATSSVPQSVLSLRGPSDDPMPDAALII